MPCVMFLFFSSRVCALNVIHQLRAPVNVLCMCLSQHFYSSHSIILLCSLAIFLPLWIYTRVHVRNLLMRRKSAYVFYPIQFENEVLAILTSPKPCTVYIRLEVEGTYALVRLINRFVNIENLERKNSGYCYWKHMKHSQHWTKRWITEQRKSSILRTYIIFYPSNDNRYSSCLSLFLSVCSVAAVYFTHSIVSGTGFFISYSFAATMMASKPIHYYYLNKYIGNSKPFQEKCYMHTLIEWKLFLERRMWLVRTVCVRSFLRKKEFENQNARHFEINNSFEMSVCGGVLLTLAWVISQSTLECPTNELCVCPKNKLKGCRDTQH